jgi:hypothetical protein
LGGQAGAEMTDFMIVLNSRSVRVPMQYFIIIANTLSQAVVRSDLDILKLHLRINRDHLWPRALSRWEGMLVSHSVH